MMFCTTLLFHSILYTINNLTQKLGRGAELITTNYTTGWSLVHIIWTCNKGTLYILVKYVFWHPARLPQKEVHAKHYLNQLYGKSSEQVSEWIRCSGCYCLLRELCCFFMVCILYLWFHASSLYLLNNQRDAALSSRLYYSLRNYSTGFRCSLHPSSGVH